MPSQVIVLTSQTAGTGKTHVAAGLAAWLKREGHAPGVLHLSSRVGDPVACPEGGWVSRAAAVLAEAAGVDLDPELESGWAVLPRLRRHHGIVVVEQAAGQSVQGDLQSVEVRRTDDCIDLGGFGGLPAFSQNLMPPLDPALADLPVHSIANGPRVGILSLPHLANFADFRSIRAAEWLTTPAPGRFEVLFVPATAETRFDSAWMRETGLDGWLREQAAGGCRVLATGWSPGAVEQVELGSTADWRSLSRMLGRRVPPPLPDEADYARLAEWIGSWPALPAFARKYLEGRE